MQGDRDGRWDKGLKQLLHLFRSGLIQRGKVGACNLWIGNDDDLGNVVHIRAPLHFHHPHDFFAAPGRKRDRHSPAQVLEIFPVIDLRLIND